MRAAPASRILPDLGTRLSPHCSSSRQIDANTEVLWDGSATDTGANSIYNAC